MANEIQESFRKAALTIAQYVSDVAEMKVKTTYLQITDDGGAEEQPHLAASTVIKLDGDSEVVVPMRQNPQGHFEVERALLDIHQDNVDVAIEYRARMMDALLGILQSRLK